MNVAEVKNSIVRAICAKVDCTAAERANALREFFSVTIPHDSGRVIEAWCHTIPGLLPELYEKWASEFAERLIETLPENQLSLLCDNSEDNNAALCLAFVMYMESAKMEKQIPVDIMEFTKFNAATPEESTLHEAMASAIGVRLRTTPK